LANANSGITTNAEKLCSACSSRRQFAHEELTFDFNTDQQEENRHQRVVDPLVQRQRERVMNNSDGERYLPKLLVNLGQRRIGEHRRGNCEQQQDLTTNRLGLEKTLKCGWLDFLKSRMDHSSRSFGLAGTNGHQFIK
jgi:hypothetical protein